MSDLSDAEIVELWHKLRKHESTAEETIIRDKVEPFLGAMLRGMQ